MDGDSFFRNVLNTMSSRGGTIHLEPTIYSFQNDLIINRQSISILGTKSSPAGGTHLQFAPNKGLVLQNADGFHAQGLRIAETSPCNAGQLLLIQNDTYGASFQDVEFIGGYRNVWLQKSAITRFNRCRFVNATGIEAINICDGPMETHGVDAAEFIHCILSASPNTNIVNMNGKAHSVKMTQCAVLFGKHAIKMTNTIPNSSGPKFFYFSDGGFENNLGYCMFLEDADDIKLCNMYLSNDGTFDGIYMTSKMTGSLSITNSKIRGCGRNGIRYLGGRLVAIGNDIVNNKQSGLYIASGLPTNQIANNFIGNI